MDRTILHIMDLFLNRFIPITSFKLINQLLIY
jgi:hypothetical protein